MRLVEVVGCSAASDEIRLEMRAEDEQIHKFEVSSGCAGVLAAMLAVEFEKLSAEDGEQQLIRPTGMQTGLTDKGEAIILMELEGGAELPLVVPSASLAVMISELEALRRQVQPGSEVRWQ